MNNKGQSILAEHAMIFFVVVAVLIAMTTFVQRSFEARIHDFRNFMVNSVMNSSVCDANCVNATGNIYYEYEPYYTIMAADSLKNEQENSGETPGNAQALGAIYYRTSNDTTNTVSLDCQLPPICTGYNAEAPPCYCTCPPTC